MSKSQSKPTIKDGILECLKDGEKRNAEIYKAVEGKKKSIDACLSRLVNSGDIRRVDPGVYRLPTVQDAPVEVENPRGEAENTETINKLLNLYDTLLDAVARSIEAEDWDGIVEKIETIKSLRWLGATADQLIKRWYLVHRGYDSNTKQAHEDAKRKTVDREKQEIETAPPEAQLKVVREYDESMQEILAKMPKPVQERNTV